MIYAGWKPGTVDLEQYSENARRRPLRPLYGVDDHFHAAETVDFRQRISEGEEIPVEMHIYGRWRPRRRDQPESASGIPFGTWPKSFEEWITDLGMMKAGGGETMRKYPPQRPIRGFAADAAKPQPNMQ